MDEGLRITVGNDIYFERSGLLDDLQGGAENADDLRNELRAKAKSRHRSR